MTVQEYCDDASQHVKFKKRGHHSISQIDHPTKFSQSQLNLNKEIVSKKVKKNEKASQALLAATIQAAGSPSQIQVDESNLKNAQHLLDQPHDLESTHEYMATDCSKTFQLHQVAKATPCTADCTSSFQVDGLSVITKHSLLGDSGHSRPVVTPGSSLRKGCQQVIVQCDDKSGDRNFGHVALSHEKSQISSFEEKVCATESTMVEGECARAMCFDVSNVVAVTPLRSTVYNGGISSRQAADFSQLSHERDSVENSIADHGIKLFDECAAQTRLRQLARLGPVTSETASFSFLLHGSDSRGYKWNRVDKNSSKSFRDAYRQGLLCSDPDEWRQHGVHHVTMQINSQNAVHVRFDALTGRPVTFSSDSPKHLGNVDDLRQSLLRRGCKLKDVSNVWILNHKRWVVWTLACYDRAFCSFVGGRYLSYSRLVQKIEARYRKEVAAGHRPIIRMILNRDAASTLPMVLCVSRIKTEIKRSNTDDSETGNQFSTVKLQLTDTWYDVDAELDSFLSKFVRAGIIRVGTKLLVTNAQLRGADQGIDPLDSSYQTGLSSRPFLLLTANSTRLARWNCKLGVVRQMNGSGGKFSIMKKVSDIVAGGGDIPLMRFVVQRRYPMMFLEKGPNAERVPLNEAEEAYRREDFERRVLKAVEKISEQVCLEVEKVRSIGASVVCHERLNVCLK